MAVGVTPASAGGGAASTVTNDSTLVAGTNVDDALDNLFLEAAKRFWGMDETRNPTPDAAVTTAAFVAVDPTGGRDDYVDAQFPDGATESARLFECKIPVNPSGSLKITTTAHSSGTAGDVVFRVRFRETKDGVAVGAWTAAVNFTAAVYTADTHHREDSTTKTYGDWNAVSGASMLCLISRLGTEADDDLADDCFLEQIGFEHIKA